MTLGAVLKPVLDIFRQTAIPYVMIGGYAVAAWGAIRATQDIDLLCEVQHVEKLKAALDDAGMDYEYRRGDPEDPIQHVIRIRTGNVDFIDEVDVLAGIRSCPSDVTSRGRTIEADSLSIQVASPEDLIVLKLLAGSAVDIEDARSIARFQKTRLDLTLLGKICPAKLTAELDSLLDG